ncbi:NAD(P)-dependent oxidoreductase [Sinomonas atrocyanea]|uniref:NAD-dependent epimerase/dehydratase family protein n=1 Tax=Sinomonas atrocyanea TaxID=37927 RepID=UPI00278062D3|nr:NAD(P)-dependent oxidoreductase [Sinomonas atrocyanea]MDQ0259510.1 nucleoside-diphosphate-sugar epimerase [Sinomonas atrocyanea]MDR6623348.1 nucleoside-diphosphate-sugar epimerase [Sinomonas atrocyanea]
MTPSHAHGSGRRVLVTGGSGLIGAAVVGHLAALGHHVTVLDITGARVPEGAASFTPGTVTDAETVRRAVAGQDAVVHLAGRAGLDRGTPEEIYAANALGTFIVMDAAGQAGVAKVVYASSINAFGLPLNPHDVLPSRYPWDEDEPAAIADAYSLSKQANENAATALASQHGTELTGLRFPLVRDIYEDEGTVFARHIRGGIEEDPRRQACEGWTYLDVRDAAGAVQAALSHPTPAAPGILVAAPQTYLRQPTEDALERYAPTVPRDPVAGRDVPVSLRRSHELLGFKAEHTLEQLSEDLLVDLDEVNP